MPSSKPKNITPKNITLSFEQALQLAKVLDAATVEDLAQARDRLRRLLGLPPFTPRT